MAARPAATHAAAERKCNAVVMSEQDAAQLRAKLVAIRGLGDWIVDMYLLFSAHRSDVFPVGDLAVCKGLQAHLGVTGIP